MSAASILTAVYDFGGVQLAEGVDPDGGTLYAVLGVWGDQNGCACPNHAPHEQLGPLPTEIAARIREDHARAQQPAAQTNHRKGTGR